MKPIALVFDAPPDHWAGRLFGVRAGAFSAAGAALAALGLAAVVGASWHLLRSEGERAQLHSRLAAENAKAAPARPRAAGPESALAAQRVRAWNTVARQLNTPWSTLLDTLESVTPEDVALVSVEPDATQAAVRLMAEARTLQALLAYEQSLRAAPLFREVQLTRHETNDSDPVRPVRLHLVLRMQTAPGKPSR